jgi:hypothetical protein
MAGFIILRDIPKLFLLIDGVGVKLQGGFRGFYNVPAGKHIIILDTYSDAKVEIELDVPEGEAVVRVYEEKPPRLVEDDPAIATRYRQLAISGAMGNALWAYPGQTTDALLVDANAQNMLHILGKQATSAKTKFTSDDLQSLRYVFSALQANMTDATFQAYFSELAYNYVVDLEMAKHTDYYRQYTDEIVVQLKQIPKLAGTKARSYYDYLVEDMRDIEEQEKSAILAAALARADQLKKRGKRLSAIYRVLFWGTIALLLVFLPWGGTIALILVFLLYKLFA